MSKKHFYIGFILVLLVVSTLVFIACGSRPENKVEDKRKLNDIEVVKRFNQIYYNTSVWTRTYWLGVPTQQNPCDLWVMQEIISEVKPDYIIETGTLKGGSTLYMAMVLGMVNKNGRIITVDINPQVGRAKKYDVFKERIEVITSDSVDPKTIEKIARLVKGRKVMVTLDSLHTKEHVLKELRVYSKFVSLGSYLVVQDTNVNNHPVLPYFGPGPMEALVEFIKENKNFKIDRSREKHLLTYYPLGFLKRVK